MSVSILIRRATLFATVAAVALGVALPNHAGDGKPELGTWGVDLEARDTDTRPGDDFFRYANGAWLDEYEIPEDLPMYGSFVKLYLKSETQVQEIIEAAAAEGAGGGDVSGKVGAMYSQFMMFMGPGGVPQA